MHGDNALPRPAPARESELVEAHWASIAESAIDKERTVGRVGNGLGADRLDEITTLVRGPDQSRSVGHGLCVAEGFGTPSAVG